jgi:4-hydroxybenzoate polyprenyltransferase
VSVSKTISSLIRLMRLPNVAIIILTQVLLRYCIIKPILFWRVPELFSGNSDFFLLVLATVLIAIGGYFINDYFDISIDEINKPGKNSVGVGIKESTVLLIYWVINGLAVIIGFFLAYRLRNLTFGLVFPIIILLLWFYSTRYKKIFLLGNIIISLLSSLVIFIVWYFEFMHLRVNPENFVFVMDSITVTTNLFIGYGIFAFLVTLFREIIKDLEDLNGDLQNGCKSLPVVLGLTKTKYIVVFLVFLVMFLVIYCSWVAYNLALMGIFFYLLGVVGIPLIYLLVKLFYAQKNEDFNFLSGLCKIIMIAGILTMQLISVAN